MLDILKNSFQEALTRLHYQATTYLPSLVVAAIILVAAYITAIFARWLIYRIFKGVAVDKFLREAGVVFILAPSGHLQATRVAADIVFWCILLSGFLLGLNVFESDLATQVARGIESLLPKLFMAVLILVGGGWLSQYLGHRALVWAANENLPSPHRVGTAVRALVMFAAVVIAADQLHFSSMVFLAAFIIIVAGAVLTAAVAIGRGYGATNHIFDERKHRSEESDERSLWSRL
jgi:hypothetical protein